MSRRYKQVKKKKLGSYPYFTVVTSITLALFVLGLFSLLILHANRLTEILREKFEVHVYLDKDLSKSRIDSLQLQIGEYPFVLKKATGSQVVFVSSDEAAREFIQQTGEDFYKVLEDNPLPPSFIVKLNPSYVDKAHLQTIRETLSGLKGVYEVDYKESLIEQINKNIRTIGLVLLIFALILLVASVLLINNTLKLALFSQRFLIRSMQLVGATRAFIQRPFLLRAFIQGIVSGVLASLALLLLLNYIYDRVKELSTLADPRQIMIILAGIILFAIVIGVLSSFIAVNRYLKMSLDELY